MSAAELSTCPKRAKSSIFPAGPSSGCGVPSSALLNLPEWGVSLSVSPASYHSEPEPLDAFVPLLLTRCRAILKALGVASYIASGELPDLSELTLDLASNMAGPDLLGASELSLKYCWEEADETASYMAIPDLPVPLEPLLFIRCRDAALRLPDLASRNVTRLPAESTELRLLDRGLDPPAISEGCSD